MLSSQALPTTARIVFHIVKSGCMYKRHALYVCLLESKHWNGTSLIFRLIVVTNHVLQTFGNKICSEITVQIFKKFSYDRLPILVKSIWVLFMVPPLCLLLINTLLNRILNSRDCQQHSLKKLLNEGWCLRCSKY